MALKHSEDATTKLKDLMVLNFIDSSCLIFMYDISFNTQ